MREITGKKAKKSDPPSYFKKKIECQETKQSTLIKITDDQTIANEFNNYFANVGPNLSAKIKYNGKKTVEYYLKSPTNKRFEFKITTDEEILALIKTLVPKTSSGYDNISPKLVIQMPGMLQSVLKS